MCSGNCFWAAVRFFMRGSAGRDVDDCRNFRCATAAIPAKSAMLTSAPVKVNHPRQPANLRAFPVSYPTLRNIPHLDDDHPAPIVEVKVKARPPLFRPAGAPAAFQNGVAGIVDQVT
jgi:hypothetical protein